MDMSDAHNDQPQEDWGGLMDEAEAEVLEEMPRPGEAEDAPDGVLSASPEPASGYPDADAEEEEDRELDDGPSMQLITFSLGDALFAMDILRVQEIIRMASVTPVPHTPSYVDGVLTLRGKIVPVVDLRTRVGMPRESQQFSTRVVVINIGSGLLGLVVDRVHQVARLPLSRLESAAATGGHAADYVQGVGTLRKRLVTLLDLDAIGQPIGAMAA